MGDVMGKVGRSYPRFEVAAEPIGALVEADEDSKLQARLGACVGIVGALALIVWLMALLVH
jgi:hypothetical protein